MSKILIISPTPSHPQDAGNRARIYQMVELLKTTLQTEVFFLFIPFANGDIEKMREYWGNKLFLYEDDFSNDFTFKEKVINKLKLYWYKIIYNRMDNRYNKLVDSAYPGKLTKQVQNLHKEHTFDYIITEYVFLSKIFTQINNAVKILDTHDLLADRYRIFLEKEEKPQWRSLFRQEEKIGFKRADYVIGIQEQETRNIQENIGKNNCAITLGYTPSPQKKENFDSGLRLIFVASNNYININGLNNFITDIFPAIIKEFPKVELMIAGSISKDQDKIVTSKNVIFLGSFDSINDIYNNADIAINPVNMGTGLKIKTIEALAFGMPLVTYPDGVTGLESYNPTSFCAYAETMDQFKTSLLELMRDKGLRKTLSERASEFVTSYNKDVSKDFMTIFHNN